MNRTIKFLLFVALLVFWPPESACGQNSTSQTLPPNILFIAVDDLRPELGCYGELHAQSPFLDRFAEQSVLFTNHFVQVPTCGASRYALLTGRSPGNSRALGNASIYQGRQKLQTKSLEGAQSFPELFRRNGYHTVCIGKISHTPDGKVFAYDGTGDGHSELPNAWDELLTPYGQWKRGWGTFFAYHDGRHREDGNGNRDLMEFIAESDNELPDGMMATTAIDRLKELTGKRSESNTTKPFLMGLGFFKPHLPWVATQSDWEAFEENTIALPANHDKLDSLFWHRSGEFYKYDMTFEKTRPLSVADQVTAKRAYLACVRYVDRQIGRVLTSLDELGLAENTIVVIWGDHGWHLGESAIWGKHSPFDRSMRSVLMVRAPGVSLPGHRCEQLVESIDLYPTLVDLCAPAFQTTSHRLDGKSIRSLLEGKNTPIRQVSLSYFNSGFTARTTSHRLVVRSESIPSNQAEWDAITDRELYDLTSSPDPVDDLLLENEAQLKIIIELLSRKE